MKSDNVAVVDRLRGRKLRLFGLFAAMALSAMTAVPALAVTLAPSQRVEVNLGASQWRYLKDKDPANAQAVLFDDSTWQTVGLPYSADQFDTFINQMSGGGQGSLSGTINWYRTVLTHSADYAGKKVMVEFEGAHTGAQVYVNGQFIPGTSALNPNATHVVGFVPFIVDLTPYLHFDGKDVIAVKVARNDAFFEDPGFSGAFRFGSYDAGIFRPVHLHVTDRVHIPENIYSGQNTWGTYVATQAIAADGSSATVRVQTNVANEQSGTQTVTLTTQIVDANGTVVATAQDQKTLAPGTVPTGSTPTFDQTLTVTKPTLWYPNNSTWGKPYMYKVLHTVSINGEVVDAKQSPLGIRVITWDKDFPYINGHKHYLWGASGRYDYPALGMSVPEEQQWRDLALLAKAGGSIYRPGHSPSSPEFVAAADAYGIFIVQPSGDGENGFATACSAASANFQQCQDMVTLKKELHRDIIIRDRNDPAILAWEADNGVMNTPMAQQLKAISQQWDPINTRAQSDRTPNPDNGDLLSCSKAGCEVFLHAQQFPNKPAWGAEYWGIGSARHAWDFELAFALSYLDPWTQGRKVNTFGMSQWYFADSPGETSHFVENVDDTHVRSLGDSMVDMNRFPKMLYYIYQANWVPYSIQPVVKLAHHWNRSGNIQVNAFSNCPSVRLLINGMPAGPDQIPNTWDTDSSADDALVNQAVPDDATAQNTTKLPGQVHWNVAWAAGKVTAQCLDNLGQVVTSDEKVTAGKADHIVLEMVPELVKPDGSAFQLTANGSDAAFVVARVVDVDGNVVPEGADVNVTFAVNGPATYQGGSQQYVTDGKPFGYHAPGDPELQFEGGMTKIALRTQFTTGPVTVTATSPGLGAGQATFNVQDVPAPSTPSGPPAIIAQPIETSVDAGQTAHFAVSATGSPTVTYQWRKNGENINGAIGPTYDTGALSTDDNAEMYSVVVSNPVGAVASDSVRLTVNPARAPTIVGQPTSVIINPGQPAVFTVAADGSAPFHYVWTKDGHTVGDDSATLSIAAVEPSDAGNYAVTVQNLVGAATSATVTLKLAPPGANLALGKKALASSVENVQGTPASGAVDGDITTRWGSEFKDPQSIQVDLGSVRTFNRVVLRWEAAYASAFEIDYSNDQQTWQVAYQQDTGTGGVQDISFESVSGRYVRMLGTKRATQYGYSLLEFEVYNGATCGDANERYTVVDPNTVTDNLSKLMWSRVPKSFTDQGAQFTQPVAANTCAAANMRLPTRAEAQAVSGANASTCAFPIQWNTWTSDFDPTDSTFAFTVSSAGDVGRVVADNFPGQAMCVSGAQVNPPVIVTQPAGETAGVGRSARFSVIATGTEPLSYEWFRNGKSVFVSNDPGYDTPAALATDDGAAYTVQVTSSQGLTVASAAARFTVDGSTTGTDPGTGDPGTGNGGGTGGGNPGGGNGDNSPGDGQNGVNLALGMKATESGSENDGYLSASQAFDGDFTTRWSSAFVDPSWIAVDLGTPQTFDHVVLRWENAHSTSYELQTSSDNQNWRTFYSNTAGVGGTERISFQAQSARYVRMFSTARSTQYGVSLFEFEIYGAKPPVITTQPASQTVVAGQTALFNVAIQSTGTVTYQWRENDVPVAGATGSSYSFVPAQTDSGATFDVIVTGANGVSAISTEATLAVQPVTGTGNQQAPSPTPTPDGTNLALHQPVTISGTENAVAFGGGNVNDGDANTRWSSAFVDPSWVEIDLGAVKSVSRVVLNWENAHATAYQIQVSTDNQNWTVAFDQPNGQGGIETVNFAATPARYMRMFGTKRSTQYGYSLWEFEIYGEGNSTTDPGQPGGNPGTGTGGGSDQAPDYTVYPGFVGSDLKNNTNGAFTDDQIYVVVIGRDPKTGVFSWLKPDGTITAASVADNDATGHLTKNGQNYPKYAFTLAQSKLLKLPKMDSGRIFVSLGEPLYIKILDDANGNVGFAGPNPLNGTDPNIGVRFDWYEFTYNDAGLWINTTQVDEFGVPLLLDVWGDSKKFHMQTGLQEAHDALYAAYAKEVPAEFQAALQNPLRIMAPGKSTFDVGQPNGHYFDDYVNQMWSFYSSNTLTVDMFGGSRRFVGKVQAGNLVFTEVDLGNGAFVGGTYTVGKPTTQDILEGKGTLAQGNSVELALEAQICAAFNRHIMEDASLWAAPSAWYLTSPANYYAKFWHTHSVGGLAYGFAYDDVSDQSSTIISVTPEHMILTIGW